MFFNTTSYTTRYLRVLEYESDNELLIPIDNIALCEAQTEDRTKIHLKQGPDAVYVGIPVTRIVDLIVGDKEE